MFHAWGGGGGGGGAENTFLKGSKIQFALAQLRVVKGCEMVIFWWFCDNLLKSRLVKCMFWCMPATFMLDWAIWSLYWVLWLPLGVYKFML